MEKLAKPEKSKVIRLSVIVLVIIALMLAIYLPLHFSGALDKISNASDLKQIILDGGVYSYLIFFAIQFLQATIIPIPMMVTTITGTLIFGPFVAFLISFVSIMLASILMFWLGKKLGKKFIIWAVGEADFNKWSNVLTKGKYTYFLMMLFPLFPDDLLCLIVGAVTNISFKFFVITNLITRPIGILCTCYLASGQLIPFSGWGIPVWIILGAGCLTLLILSFKYQNKLEALFNKILSKKQNSNTDNKECEF